MPLDADFFAIAQAHFNPYTQFSGTEHVGPLLYSLARMTRPRSVVEYGSGYSTLFILQALADNLADAAEERRQLIDKTRRILLADAGNQIMRGLRAATDFQSLEESQAAEAQRWFESGGIACGVNPQFYLEPYSPRLFSIEQQPATDPYVQTMSQAVRMLGHQELFTHLCGTHFKPALAEVPATPIDWAWNDVNDYYDFFVTFWERLNPAGGLLIFHNVPSDMDWLAAVHRMKQERAADDDLEVLILEEPHKFCQNGCAILRRTSGYRPRFFRDLKPADIVTDLERLLALQA